MPDFLSSAATSIHYEVSGEGPFLVFLHGWSQSGSVWRALVRSLSPRYRCLVSDLRGHGLSASPGDGYAMENLVADLAGLLDHFDMRDVTVIGWSLGAMVALAAFPALRERLSSLVLVSGTAKFTSEPGYPCALSPREPRVLGHRLQRDSEKAREEFFRGMFTSGERSSTDHARIEEEFFTVAPKPSRHGAARSLETLATADLRAGLDAVDIPVILVHGSDDSICPVGSSRFMAERLPNATLKVLDGAGHAPMLTRAAELGEILTTFLGKVYEGNR
ncbi:MAG: alpha/beta hydrolase [Geobacteraceae bacterium]|nr:alpha/beta hydrolase [Geobacteraceae bacterium]